MSETVSIKQLRIMNDYTQAEMANLLNISSASYSLREMGKRSWSLEEVIKVSKLFDLPLMQLKEVEVLMNRK